MPTLSLTQTIERQLELFNRICNSSANIKKLGQDNITRELLEAKLQILEKNWKEFQENHTFVLSQKFESTSKSDYFVNDCYGLTEDGYINSTVYIAQSLKRFPQQDNVPAVQQTASTRKLPNIEVPTFSGKFTDWLDFKDLFKATIIRDDRLSNAEKLQQLKTHVQGEAADMLKTIQITDLNFPIAWKQLEDHYSNKRRLIALYTNTLLDLPAVRSDSPAQLQSLLNTSTNAISSLEQLKRPTNQWDDLLVPIIARKFDFKTLREWEKQVSKSADPPTFVQLTKFITERIDFLETTSVTNLNKSKTQENRSINAHVTSTNKCAFCANTHFITQCNSFKDKTSSERQAFVNNKKLCFNCLGFHPISNCRSERRCIICNKQHHTLLHEDTSTNAHVSATGASHNHVAFTGPSFAVNSELRLSLVAQSSSIKPTLLATALVKLRGADGRLHTARAMIDPGSQSSFVSEVLLRKLQQPYSAAKVPLSGIGGYSHIPAKGHATLQLTSAFNPKAHLQLNALVLPFISKYSHSIRKLNSAWSHLKGLELADDFRETPCEIDILLGADVFPEILLDGLIKGPPGTPMAQRTILGWIISGPTTNLKSLIALAHS